MWPGVPDPLCDSGVKWVCLKWLFLSGMSLMAKVKKTTYLLGSVTQILKQASFSVDENKHRTMHAWQKHVQVIEGLFSVGDMNKRVKVKTTARMPRKAIKVRLAWKVTYVYTLVIITGPEGNSQVCFSEYFDVFWDEVEGNIERLEGKQNYLFPLRPVNI